MLLQKLFQSIVLIQLLEGVIELINGSLAHLQTTNICSESRIRLILNHVWKMNIWKSLNCNFVDTLLKTKDISRKGLVFHVSKWILRKSISSPFLLDSSSFLYLLTIARFKINFQIKTIFFYFGKKIPSAMAIFFYCC